MRKDKTQRRKHSLIVYGGDNEYTLELDGEIISTDFGNILQKPSEYLFYALAHLNHKTYLEGVVVSSCKNFKGFNLEAMLKIVCRKYENMINERKMLKDMCQEIKKNLKDIEKKLPPF